MDGSCRGIAPRALGEHVDGSGFATSVVEVVHVALRRRKDSGAWEITIPRPGRRIPHRESNRDWTRSDALTRELELLQRGAPTAYSLHDAIARWRDEYEPHLNNARSYDSQSRTLDILYGSRALEYAAEIAAEIRRTKGLRPATLNRRLALLRRLCNLAHEEWGWLDSHIKIKVLSERGNERHIYLTRAKVEELRMTCTNKEAGDLIVFSAFTGVRHSELFRIRAEHIVNGVLRLDARTKNGKPRAIPLHPRALTIGLRLPLAISSRMLRREWDLARTKLNMLHVHWHDLRHTFASWLVQAGVSILEVSKLLGHSTIEVTMRYAHLAPDSLARAIERLEP